jgi:starch phosphorylase
MDRVESVIGNHLAFEMKEAICCDDTLNMTYLALNLSHYVNGVAKKHGETSRHLFAPYIIDSITNGVRAATWISTPFQELFDRHIPGWRGDNFSLRYALSIPRDHIWDAHMQAKRELISYVNRETNAGMPADHLTLGFARRAAAYKRAGLIFQDVGRLRKDCPRGRTFSDHPCGQGTSRGSGRQGSHQTDISGKRGTQKRH